MNDQDRQSSSDPIKILRALGRTEPAVATTIRGGADATIWRVDQAGKTFALRLLRPNQTGQAQRELCSMSAAASAGVPVPGVIEAGTWGDRPAMLVEWADGTTLAQALSVASAHSSSAESLGRRFGEVHAAIHRTPAPAELVGDWKPWPSPFPEVLELLATVNLRPPVLIHLDYHPLNVLCDQGAITAVLDWANAYAGDPRADLARTMAIVELTPAPPHMDSTIFETNRRSFLHGWLSSYTAEGGSFDGIAPFCWWAGLGMLYEHTPRIGRPDLPWLTHDFLQQTQAWTSKWREQSISKSVSGIG